MSESGTSIAVITGGKSKGSNMAALVRAGSSETRPWAVRKVIVPSEDAPAVDTARHLGVDPDVVEGGFEYGPRLVEALAGCQVVCLAGFMQLLPEEVLAAFPNRVLNIHPALLPKFGGKGMFGIRVHRAVIEAGETVSGCTVHFVTDVYDEGAILMQRTCPVLPGDTPEELARRVLELEHQVYPDAVTQLVGGSD